MRVLVALVLGILCSVSSAGGQASSSDPSRFQLSRADLQALLVRYDALAASTAFSGASRDDARETAAQIRDRLEYGDFRVGDRIVLDVRGQDDIPDTVPVQPGPMVVLGQLGEISLAGVLRSELQQHLTHELGRFIREPVVYSSSMIRLAVDGQIQTPGFHVLPAEMLLSEVLMAAGGPTADADMDRIRIWRGDTILLERDEVGRAIVDGDSLDQLNIRAGDRIEVGGQPSNAAWLAILRYGVAAASLLVLGIRVF
jgi:protein involved in polysaccharide export with SLBB domain